MSETAKKSFFSSQKISEFKDFSCIVPAMLFLLAFTYFPVLQLIQISFTNWNLINDDYQYVGFKNWLWLFKGSGTKYLLNSLKVTFLYSLGELAITVGGGLLLALIFNIGVEPGTVKNFSGKTQYSDKKAEKMKKSFSKKSAAFSAMRAIVFMPKYVAMSSAAVIFLWMLDKEHGVFNYFLGLLGVSPVDWLGNRKIALFSVLMLTGWRAVGYGMIVYVSALQGISRDYYEAADIDGASAIQKFFHITLPMLSPTTLFMFITTFLASMKVFQSVDILTGGGPYRSTEVLVFQIYKYAMEDFRMDRAAAVSLMFFVMLLIVTTLTMKISDRNVHYDS